MASLPATAGTKVERLSFAKVCASNTPSPPPPSPSPSPSPSQEASETDSALQIAAAGIKPSIPQQQHQQSNSSKHTSPSSAQDSAASSEAQPVGAATQSTQSAQAAVRNSEISENENSHLEAQEHGTNTASPDKAKQELAQSRSLAPAASDDVGTQVSSSSGSVKPPSLDGKSVASGTTFALDEKESLRPDDSASLKAVDDEDVFSAPSAGPSGAPPDLEDETRAFTDQLREIDSMEGSHGGAVPQRFVASAKGPRGMLYIPPQGPGIGHVPGVPRSRDDAETPSDAPPDPKLLEALESPRDRIWVLKLEQDIFDFVKDAKENSLDLPQCNAYHRMLAHKIADYYTLGHFVDDSASAVRLFKTPNLRIPPPLTGITTPSTAASTPPPAAPQMKILRRGDGNGSKTTSKANSEAGESGNEDDKSKPATREEREARYAEARLRIMGSAKPSDNAEAPKEREESRSSSAAGKKAKKKQRTDSEDGFEARSAYVHYTPPYGANGYAQSSYGYPGYTEAANTKVIPAATFNTQDDATAFQRYPSQPIGAAPWTGQAFASSNQPQQWSQKPGQPVYDLSNDFQRAMTLHNQAAPTQPTAQSTPYNIGYNNQCYAGGQPLWPQQNFQAAQQSQQGYGYPQHPQTRPTSSSSYGHDSQGYQFGQLPSQTFPGRPSSNLEHPLPGSYKSKHFDPQSVSFVPGQQGNASFRPFTPQGAPTLGYSATGYGFPSPIQRQGSSQSHASSFGSPHIAAGGVPISHQTSAQAMVHPLPQPVFPRQPSPSLPLPQKPNSNSGPVRSSEQPPPQQQQQQRQHAPQQPQAPTQGQSTIAKWGAPASLPAKPPPPAEPFDPSRYPHIQRQPSYNTAAAARMPGGTVPGAFGPPVLANGSGVPVVVNGSQSGLHSGKRS